MQRFERAGVVGGGTMGTQIAYVLATSGAEVWLVEPDPGQAERARAELDRRRDQDRAAPPGPADPAGPERIRLGRTPADLPEGLDVVVEAVPERAELKRRVLAEAERRRPGLLGTNTSALPLSRLAADLADPAALVGLHFFNPAWSMQLVEIVRADATAPATLQRARDLVAQLGKESIEVVDRPGFATSRLGVALALEAMRMLEAGVASAADIDKAMVLGYRHPVGPLRLTDVVGLDVRLDIARALHAAYGERFAPPAVLVDKVAAGELGRKTGRGFYVWSSS